MLLKTDRKFDSAGVRGYSGEWGVSSSMAKEYLPKVLNPFVALSTTDRDAREGELLKSLNGLEAEVDNVAELIRGDKLGDFKAKAAFLRARFVQGI